MTSKILPLMVLFTLLVPGLALGYWDLAVDSVNVETVDPTVGESIRFNATIRNIGNETVSPGADDHLNISFGDGTYSSVPLPPLDENDQTYIFQTHTYSSEGDYTFKITVNGADDANATNDEGFSIVAVHALEYAFSGTDYSLSMYPGEAEMQSGSVSNTGDLNADIQLQATDLTLEGESETIDMSNAVFPSSTIPLSKGMTYDDVKVTVATDASQTPGTYTGTLQVVNLDNSDEVTDIGDITVELTNEAPVVNVENQVVVIGEEFTYDVAAVSNDPEGQELVYTLVSGPEGLAMSSEGLLSGWMPTAISTETISVNVSDGYSTTQASFDVEVKRDVPNIEFDSDTVTFGGSNADRGDTYTEYLTLENTGSQTITGIDVEVVSTSGSELDEDYEASIFTSATSLAPGESTTVSVTLTIPADASAREKEIGRVKVAAQGDVVTVTDTIDVLMQAQSMLKIDKVVAEIDGDDETVSDGEDLDVKIGDTVILTVTLENRYSSSDDIELEDAFFQVYDDEDWEIDEESSEKDIKEDDDETFEVTFTVPDDADEEDSRIIIEAFADDGDHGFEHYDEFEFNMEIDKESHEIIIEDWEFSRDPVDCNDRTVDLEVTMKNIGKNDEDEVMLNIVSKKGELDWYKRIRDIEIDEGDDETETVTISLPDDLREGAYFVDIEVYYDDDELSDEKTIALDVVCGTGSGDDDDYTDGEGSDNGVVVTNPDDGSDGATGQPVPNPVYGEEVSTFSNFRSSTGYMVLLILVVVGLLVGIGYLIYGAAHPPAKK
ncbi:MAG: CARDB domain-containing protein [Nanobdellota archaeon]